MGEHILNANLPHSRWNRAFPPRLEISSGDVVHVECLDATGGQISPTSSVPDFASIDTGRVHALTGPIFVRNASPGDLLQIDLLQIKHRGWGWSGIIPNLGLLSKRFNERHLFIWELHASTTESLQPAIVPLRPFCGVIGLAPAESGEFRTQPPSVLGGNLDVRELTAGSSLFLPIQNSGGLLSIGDVHAAQGDGEVSMTGIECPADVSIRVSLHHGLGIKGPFLQSAPTTVSSAGEWIVIESAADPLEAARNATDRMIDFITAGWQILPEQAYMLCSVAMNLRLSQVVNAGQITVSAALPKSILPPLSRVEVIGAVAA
jgi:acetamidase/formamidase